MSTRKRKKQSKRPEVRSLKIQPKFRLNKWSTSVVPELILSGKWLKASGFKKESHVVVHTSKGLIVIRLQDKEE